MFRWIAKKWLCKKINEKLADKAQTVGELKTTLKEWLVKADNVETLICSVLKKLDDNKVDADELEQISDEFVKMVKEW